MFCQRRYPGLTPGNTLPSSAIAASERQTMNLSLDLALALGFLLGLKHATEADHLVCRLLLEKKKGGDRGGGGDSTRSRVAQDGRPGGSNRDDLLSEAQPTSGIAS